MLFLIRYVYDQCKAQVMCDKATVGNGEMLESVPSRLLQKSKYV